MQDKIPYKIAFIKWIDSSRPSENTEVHEEDLTEPEIIYSIGLLIKNEKDYAVIAQSFSSKVAGVLDVENIFDQTISIPRCSIQKIIEIDINKIQQNTNNKKPK